jgi:hypothetical protein
VGELVLDHLRALDRLAALRFETHFRDELTDEELDALRAPSPSDSPAGGTIPRPRPVRPES